MQKDLKVTQTVEINSDSAAVWKALTDKELIKQYFFGTEAISDWKAGSKLIFRGKWEEKTYEDKGNILESEPGKLLQYNYWSAFSGLEDKPENYSIVTYKLEDKGDSTVLYLSQEGFASDEARQHGEGGWQMVLDGLKKLVEAG